MHLQEIQRTFLRRRWIRIAVSGVAVVVVAVVAFRHAGSWLVVSDALPEHLDAIGTFAGENVRVDYSKKLAEVYPSARWFLSDYKNGHGRLLQKNNFDMSRVFITDTCRSTISEVQAMARWIETLRGTYDHKNHREVLHIGLVSSPYHMRRISIMASRRIKKERIHLYFLPVPFSEYEWNRDTLRYWWRSNQLVSITTSELLKLGYFLLTGYF